MNFIEKKISGGEAVDDVKQGEDREELGGSKVLDLAEYLKRSINDGAGAALSARASVTKKPTKKATAKKVAPKKGSKSA